MIKQTVEKGVYPHGLAYKFINILEEKHKPSDSSKKILLTSELRAVPLKMANDYNNDVVSVLARFNIILTETEFIEFMSVRIKNISIAKIFIDHLNKLKMNQSLETLCNEIAAVQKLLKVFGSNTSSSKGQKEVNLTSANGKKSGKKGDVDKKERKDNDSGRKVLQSLWQEALLGQES